METFRGEQLHTVDYPGARALPRPTHRRGGRRRVGGPVPGRARAGHRHGLGHPARAGLAHRRLHPRPRPRGGRARRGAGTRGPAAGERRQRDRAGAARAGARRPSGSAPTTRHPMFARSSPTACGCADGTFEPADVILWATGFRPAVDPPGAAAPAQPARRHPARRHHRRRSTRACSWSATARRRAPSAPTGPAGWPRAASRSGWQRTRRISRRRAPPAPDGRAGRAARRAGRCGRSRTPPGPARAARP